MRTPNLPLQFAVLAGTLAALTLCAAQFSWQTAPAHVNPRGDLAWAPEPYVFSPGSACRYIDFEHGDDTRPGTNAATAWQHHPWDDNARDVARADTGADTYIFKKGVIYRGTLLPKTSGRAGQPLQLTVDPAWGQGQACLYGSDLVTGWQRGGHPHMPESDRVWHADLPFAPRAVFMVDGTGAITRLTLARTPNWRVSDPDDVLSEWWLWENPRWWTGEHKTNLNNRMVHLGIDTKNLTGTPDDYVGAYVWSEWGIVMGAPYAARVEAFDAAQKAIAFEGPWMSDSQQLHRNNRYMLEDLPHFLDEPGEFWFEKRGDGGRLYLRLADDRDPGSVSIEAARRACMLDATALEHVHINGLTFRFNNTHWDLNFQGWQHPDVESAAIRLVGRGTDIAVTHCRFEHVIAAIRMQSAAEGGIANVLVADNTVAHTDQGGISLREGARSEGKTLTNVRVLRNSLREIGFRPARVNGHMALTVAFPDRAEIAGNIIERCGGAGLFLFGGKGSGGSHDVPFSRILVHHNKVVDPLLIANDWGGIETWQGGPFYVFNNISGNPGGLMHWTHDGRKKEGTPRFGHAYYMDGAFNNYYFNNIAWGKNNELGSKYANCAAFQEIIGYQNALFNNTVYKFVIASRRQAPQAGRNKYLGNVFQDLSAMVFRHSDKEGVDPNARDAGAQATQFAYATMAYANNVYYDVTNKFGVFEAEGGDYRDLASFSAALKARHVLAWDDSVVATNPPLRDAAQHDFRPAPLSAARGRGVTTFVPWALYAVVGEWNFLRNHADPTCILDEHWYMTDYFIGRDDYYTRPMYPFTAVNVGADSFVSGPLENWTHGALALNGRDQYLMLANSVIDQPFEYSARGRRQRGGWARVVLPEKIIPGQPFEAQISFSEADPKQKVCAHLHWSRGDSWGGFNAWGGQPADITGRGPFTFSFTPEDHDGLESFSLLVFVSPTGNYEDNTRTASVPIGKAAPGATLAQHTVHLGGAENDVTERIVVQGAALKNPQIRTSSFLAEAYLKTEPGQRGGTLIAKSDGTNGWAVSLNESGAPVFTLHAAGAATALEGTQAINDGAWHHLIAEADRTHGRMTVYVNGNAHAQRALDLPADASLANSADMIAGKGMACTIEFLRIALGTLADAHTTIEELYTWQFDGPQYRDFTGAKPAGARDAGALQSGK